MSKVVCDICGTSYPATTTQCPICGCVKPINTGAVIDIESASGAYTHVKGGHFSKKNVKKMSGGFIQTPQPSHSTREMDKEIEKTKRITRITAAIILLVTIAVCLYLFVDIYRDFLFPAEEETQTTEVEEVVIIPCEDIDPSHNTVTLNDTQQHMRLEVICTPANTTDTVHFESTNQEIVLVDHEGNLTAVSDGEATIIISCGQIKKQCRVICEGLDIPVTEFSLNRTEFTLFFQGDSWVLYNGVIPVTEVVWTSANPEVATIENGKVVAVSKGDTFVYADYDGNTYSCLVHCDIPDEPDIPEEDMFTIESTDVTIAVGEEFYLLLRDAAGDWVKVEWVSTNPSTVDISGNRITGKAVTEYSRVYTIHEGVEYSCIVRVKAE